MTTTVPDTAVAPAPAPTPTVAVAPRGHWRIPLIAALALAFGFLALISGIAYIAVLAGANDATERLLVDRASRAVETEVATVRSKLDPVTEEIELLAGLMAAGRIDVDSPVAVREALAVMVSKTPAISIAAFDTLDMQLHHVIRQPDGTLLRGTVPLASLAHSYERFRNMPLSHKTFWGELFWSNQLKQQVLNVRTPVRRIDDAFIGGLVATVAVGDLSYLIQEPGDEGRYFILVGRGRQHVLAHRRLIDPHGLDLSEDNPLPTIKQVDDPILAHIWDPPARKPSNPKLGQLVRVVSVEGHEWVFVYRELTEYGPEPWLVGRYFPIEEATGDLNRLMDGALVGAATLAIAFLTALLMGLRMARSIGTITSAAESIERLEFDHPFHRRSRLREIDDASHSLDKARGALKWFGAYVPRRVVFRLMEAGENGLASRRRDVTVMFTDIVEFTPQAEDLHEQDTAELLNHHFALLGACIEHEQGVIDKYIGDAVMAVWGGLTRTEDHADHAIRAAVAIAKVVREDNVIRKAAGRTPIRMRIGLHSGPVVVGNIGAPGRVNFTVVGDTVNVAQRFEQLGKEYMKPEDDIVLLVSGATVAAVTDRAALGIVLPRPEPRMVKGHDEPVEVYRLV